jgi:nitroreductase
MSYKYKKLVLRYAPPLLQKLLRDLYFALTLLPECTYDYYRFLLYAGLNKNRDTQLERAARITVFYHQVEKGLSLADTRPGFGLSYIPDSMNTIDAYFAEYGITEPATTAVAALLGYLDYHEAIGHQVDNVHKQLFTLLDKYHIPLEQARSWRGGVLSLSRTELETKRRAGFKSFFESRYSMRQFAGGSIPEQAIRSAVELAQKTPSVCNRQSWRVHAFSDSQKMAQMLNIQSGSQGFGEQASVVLVVTCELGSFLSVEEHYQPWIDGGMFAMSLCLALHDLGYGTCCLNWSKKPKTDKTMRAAISIPPSQQIIMLIAVGTVKEAFTVARSYRPVVDQCLVIHDH